MKKFVCSVCGYVYEGEAAPAECPICHAPAEKFKEQAGEKTWAAEHVVGVAQGAPEDIMADLRASTRAKRVLSGRFCHVAEGSRAGWRMARCRRCTGVARRNIMAIRLI